MPVLLPFKASLHKGTSIKICVLTMGQYLLELIMNFENSGSLLHWKHISKKILEFANSEAFTWHFIPPHLGRLWEAGMCSMKYCLRDC
jgi:hypothetical protein